MNVETAHAHPARTLFDRLDALNVPKASALSDANRAWVRASYDAACGVLKGIDDIEAALQSLILKEDAAVGVQAQSVPPDETPRHPVETKRSRCYAARFLADTRRTRDDCRTSTIEGYYDGIVRYLNETYGTNLSCRALFESELGFGAAPSPHASSWPISASGSPSAA